MNLDKKYWKGCYKFSRSFWIKLISSLCMLQLTLYLSKSLISTSSGYQEITIYVVLVFTLFPLYWLGYIWLLTGAIRSGFKYKNSATDFLLKGLAVFTLVILTVILIAQTTSYISTGHQFLRIILKTDSASISGFKYRHEKRTLKISGAISFDLPVFLENFLSKHPDIRSIHLESSGGFMIPAYQIIKLITSKKLDTYVGKSCQSACAIIFLAGKKRTISETARLGFHQPHSSSVFRFPKTGHFHKEFMFMKSRHIPDSFIRRALETPETTLWFPAHKELIVSGYVTHITESPE